MMLERIFTTSKNLLYGFFPTEHLSILNIEGKPHWWC